MKVLVLLVLFFISIVCSRDDDRTVDITGLNKVSVLHVLWDHQIPASFFTANNIPSPEFDPVEAEDAINGYVDYLCGRCMKIDISKDFIDSMRYDYVAGAGTMARAIATLRSPSTNRVLDEYDFPGTLSEFQMFLMYDFWHSDDERKRE